MGAGGGRVPDLVRPDLRILFCGINPGRRSGELSRHFAGPSNRFWKVLYGAGLTPRLLDPSEQEQLLDLGIGITNLVPRTTAAASDLTTAELRAGARRLRSVARRFRPAAVAVLGVQAYRTAFRQPAAHLGRQAEGMGAAQLWVLANPSGLQARYSLADMVASYRELAESVPPRRVSPAG